MHVPVVTYGNFVAKTVRKFYFNLPDKPNDDPQICAAHSHAIRSFTNIDKLWDPSICPPKKKTRATGIGRKVKAPEIWQELVVWFVDIQKALKGYLPKQLFKMKVKKIYANWLEQIETLLEE